MSRISLGLVLALIFLASLLVFAPARLISLALPADQVHMQAYTGTLWRGSASRALVKVGPGYLHLGAVQWQLAPLSLLTLSPRLTLHSQWGQQRIAGDVVLRGDQDLDLHEFEVTVDADLLRQFAPVTLSGTLNASFEELVIRDQLPVAGKGRLVWQNGAWDSPQGFLPLGSYALDINYMINGGLTGTVLTLSGPVEAEGGVELLGREYSVDILVGGDSGLERPIQQALSLIATPEGSRYRVALEGEFQE